MSRKGKLRQQAKAKRPARPKPTFRLYYRQFNETFHKIFLWLGIVAGAVALVVIAVLIIRKLGVTTTGADYLREARKNFVLGYPDRALLSYHQAESAEQTDAKIKDEIAMARAWAEMAQGGQIDRALNATLQALTTDSTLTAAHVGLAQLYSRSGSFKQTLPQTYSALKFASAANDTPSVLAASLVLESCYRQTDQIDSAAKYAEQAVNLANAVGDPRNLLSAESGAGFCALRQGKLEKGKLFFGDILARAATGGSLYEKMGKAGLADYFHRSGNYDSASFYAAAVVNAPASPEVGEVFALASQVLGRTLRDKGDLPNAISSLSTSLDSWLTLRRQTDLIDNLNDLGRAYLLQKDYFKARKYYIGAATLAVKYGLTTKDDYDDDMDIRYLKNLSQDEYLLAGTEGTELAKRYSLWPK
jgi:tetratricopeptide (TPR) repeat protein